jgi:hypothetical protein
MRVAIIKDGETPRSDVHTLLLPSSAYNNLCTPKYTTTNICLKVNTINELDELIIATEERVKQILREDRPAQETDIFLGLPEAYCNLQKLYFDTIISPEYIITQQLSPSATFEQKVIDHLVKSFREFRMPRNGKSGGAGKSEPGLWRKLFSRFKIQADNTVTFNSVTQYTQPQANPSRTSQLNPNKSGNSYSLHVYNAKKNNAKPSVEKELVPIPKSFEAHLREILDHEPELLLHIYADKLLGSFKDAVNTYIAASPTDLHTIPKMIASINALKPQIQELLLSRLFRQHVDGRNVNTSLVMSIAKELVNSAEKSRDLDQQLSEFTKNFIYGYNIITKFTRDVEYFVEPAYHIIITTDVKTNLVFYSDEIQILYKSSEYTERQQYLDDLFKKYKKRVLEIGITEAPKNYPNWKCNNYAFDICYIVKHGISLNPAKLFELLVQPHVEGKDNWSMSINNWFASQYARNTLLNQLNNTVNIAIYTLSRWIQIKTAQPPSAREDLLSDFISRFQETIGHSSVYYDRRLYTPQLKTPYGEMVSPFIQNLLTNCKDSINQYHAIIKCYDVFLQRLIEISSEASINVLSSYTDATPPKKPFYYIVFEILLCRYMGVQRPEENDREITQFYAFIDMMVRIIAEKKIPFTRFAHEHMQDELIELLKTEVITDEKSKKLFIKYVVFKYFYRGEEIDENKVINSIYETYITSMRKDINQLKGSRDKRSEPKWYTEILPQCSYNDCGAFHYTNLSLTSNKYILDILNNSHHRVLGTGNSYGALMNGLFSIIKSAIDREKDLTSLFGTDSDVVGMIHEYKTFSDKLYVILRDLSHSIYGTFQTLKKTIEAD